MWVDVSGSPAKLPNRAAKSPFPARRGSSGDGAADHLKVARAKVPGRLAKEESQLRDGRYLLAYGYRANKSNDA
jgi:hypothetical protein